MGFRLISLKKAEVMRRLMEAVLQEEIGGKVFFILN